MKLGVDSYSTRNSALDAAGVLELAGDLGLQGVLFELSPFSSFHDAELERIRQAAQRRGLYVEMGMGSIFHWHPMAAKGRELLAKAGCNVNVSDAQIVIEHLQVAKKLGSPLLRCVGGNLFTRDEGHDMTALADAAVAILREASKAAEAMGMKIALENHADFTVRELASIQARVNSPAFGFTLDCANLAFDLDDPLRLARIMAPYALTTHFKNYRVLRTSTGPGPGELRSGRRRDRPGRDRPNPGPLESADPLKYRDPFAIRALQAGHSRGDLFPAPPGAAGRRLGLVPETVVDQAHARRAPGQPGRRPAVLGPGAGAPEGLGPLGAEKFARCCRRDPKDK